MQESLPWFAGAACVALGLAAVLRKRTEPASWCFLVGMLILATGQWIDHRVHQAAGPEEAAGWAAWGLAVDSLLPGVWLCFSLVYARGNRREFLARWRLPLVAALIVPPVVAAWHFPQLVEPAGGPGCMPWIGLRPAGKLLVGMELAAAVAILMNFEKTFRASVGVARWRIKYLALGASLIFGVKVYTLSQCLIYSTINPAITDIGSVAALIACGLMAVGYSRESFGALDIYPSREMLQGSLTVLLVGSYLMIVGVLAQVVAALGGADGFPAQAFIVLLGLSGLALVLMSDRLRETSRRLVSRHLRRPQHDFRRVWAELARCGGGVLDPARLAARVGRLLAETFEVLSTGVFLIDGPRADLVWSSSPGNGGGTEVAIDGETIARLTVEGHPFDLESATGAWADGLRAAAPVQFRHGGRRLALPLAAGDHLLGIIVLGDRVNGVAYSGEELELLKCMGDHLAAGLWNLRLADELMQAKELEAFQTLSAFFAHDLKNAANSLTLMLRNLPVHFDNPEFRADAIRGVGNTVERINEMVSQLGAMGRELVLDPVATDLSLLAGEVLDGIGASTAGLEVIRGLAPMPAVPLDRERIRSVVTNLVDNACEAVGGGGVVRVATESDGGQIILSVTDNGCGMSPEFIRDSLFRPFCSTKSKGLGIGMFQCRKIIEAHRGRISVDCGPENGTCIRVMLPVPENSNTKR